MRRVRDRCRGTPADVRRHRHGVVSKSPRVTLPHEPAGTVFLLRVGAGTRLPSHGHGDSEVTQVLFGAFDDGRARFQQGDFDAVDHHVRHRPVVHAQGECVCLVSLQGGVRYDMLARLAGALVGL